jgi:hypothetical protein
LTKKHTDYDWCVERYDESFGDATCAKTEENVLEFSNIINWINVSITIYARAKSSTPKIVPSA